MSYRIGERVKRDKRSIKKYIIGATASVLMIVGVGIPAMAASNNYCGSSDHGCDQAALVGAQCDSGAASGAFGAFGLGNNWAGGANGPATGASNSAVCGSPQGNP